jgi:hypothetical protein
MSSQNAEPLEYEPNASVPRAPVQIGADVAHQVVMGPFVSKVLFGTEEGPNKVNIVATVTLPTPQLLQFATQVLRLASTPEVLQTMQRELTNHVQNLEVMAEQVRKST